MDLQYEESSNEAKFFLTDFSCTERISSFVGSKYFKIIWAKKGRVPLKLDNEFIEVEQHQLIYLTPHHKLELVEPTSDIIMFSFNREFYCIKDNDDEVACHGLLFYGSSEIPILKLDLNEQKSIGVLLEVFIEEFNNQDHIQGEMLLMLLKRLLIKSARLARNTISHTKIDGQKMDIIRQYHGLVEMHFREKHKVADYADIMFKSPKTLANIFSQFNDKTPLQIINERIILEAKRLLLNTDLTNKEISRELNFDSPSHFSRFFKNNTQKSPSDFKLIKA